MGGGSTKTTEVKNEQHDPWAAQQPYLTDAFSQAQNIYKTQQAQNDPGYQGDFVAAPRPDAMNAFQQALGTSSGTLTPAGANMVNEGQGLTGAGAGGLFNLAGDQTNNTIRDAAKYADNPYMGGMVDAAMRDANRQVNEEALPGIDRAAAGTNNLNSTRNGIAQGIVQRGLAEKTADVSSQLRGQAYSQGLTQAGSDLDRRLQASTALGGLGISALGAGSDLTKNGLDQSVLGSTMLQQGDQNVIDNAIAKTDYTQSKDWNNLANYWNIVGDKSWGGTVTGTSTSTQKNNPSALSSIGSGFAVLGSLMRCDVRVKNVFGHFSTSPEGLKFYAFAYKDDPTQRVHIGPMAQDVELLHPEAVVEIDGIKHINLAAL
jgi:hypothetical protein